MFPLEQLAVTYSFSDSLISRKLFVHSSTVGVCKARLGGPRINKVQHVPEVIPAAPQIEAVDASYCARQSSRVRSGKDLIMIRILSEVH